MNHFKFLAQTLTLLVLCLSVSRVSALVLSPVHLAVHAKSKSSSLQVTNDSDTRMVIDVRVFRWLSTDEQGIDKLEPTNDVIPSKPVLTIESGKVATLRFLAITRTPSIQDNYRVILTDITPAAEAKLSVRTRQILPLFVVNDESARGTLSLKDGLLTNVGNRHVRITSYKASDKKEVKILRYVLPGKSTTLPISDISDVTYNDDLF